MSSARVLLSCIVLLGACESADPAPRPEPAKPELAEPELPQPEPTTTPEPEPEAVAFEPAQLDELPDHPGLAIGPAAAASEEQRIDAALSLLSDGSTAAQLPTIAADAGKRFDPRLADKLTPEPVPVSAAVVPKIVMKTPTVGPGFDMAIVRRIVRLHINQVRACYDNGLEGDASLAGKAVIEWTIEPDGKVSNAHVVESTVGIAVAQCTSKAIGRLKFPVPQGGGSIQVKYPFEFDPG